MNSEQKRPLDLWSSPVLSQMQETEAQDMRAPGLGVAYTH